MRKQHVLASALLGALAAVAPALASEPVPRVIVGCVVNGAFISSDGYHIRPRDRAGQNVELGALEGRKVTIEGLLLPGDAFIVEKPLREAGPCDAK
jgi:hypothetical protein